VRAGGTVLIPRVLAGGAIADPVRRDPVTTAFRTLIQETQASPAVLGALSIVGEGLLQLTTVASDCADPPREGPSAHPGHGKGPVRRPTLSRGRSSGCADHVAEHAVKFLGLFVIDRDDESSAALEGTRTMMRRPPSRPPSVRHRFAASWLPSRAPFRRRTTCQVYRYAETPAARGVPEGRDQGIWVYEFPIASIW
jgi:hypothetical protein